MRIKLQIPIKISEICSILDIKRDESKDEYIEFICTDSRLCENGDLFIALLGESYNGADFCDEAIKKGAYVIADKTGENIYTVNETRTTLLKLAEAYKKKLKKLKYTVGVTGSAGKSTTKEFLREILSEKYKVHATIGNYNNHIGMPITILSADKDTELLILEMGMNAAGEIAELSEFAKPDIAIITNIGTAHIGRLGSRENIAKAKLEILFGMKRPYKLIVPYGEPYLSVEGAFTTAINNSCADLNISLLSESESFTSAHVSTEKCEFDFSLYLSGKHIIKDLSSAIAAALMLKLSEAEVIRGISKISNNNIRQKMLDCKNFKVLDDSYNSSPEAAISAIEALSKDTQHIHSALFSDMLELGEYSELLHFELGKCAAQNGFKRLYIFGEYKEYIKAGAIAFGIPESEITVMGNESLDDFVRRIYEKAEKDEIILAKASHATQMKTVLKMLEERCK